MVSLVVATWNRVTELDRLLTSLDAQTFDNFEVIVVDQNGDDRLVPLLQHHSKLQVQRIRCEIGASKARNMGLCAARGDIIATPDDDCWYPPDLLCQVTEWFNEHQEFDAVFIEMRNEKNERMAPKLVPKPGLCTKKNVWYCTAGITAFMRVRLVKAVGSFREDIGPGTISKYQACEDIDYYIRPLELGFRMYYDPSMVVYHPEMNSPERLQRTTYSYALSMGHMLRVHKYSWRYLSGFLARSFGGAAVHFCKGDLERAHLYLLRAGGQFQGYFSNDENGAKPTETSTP